MLVSFLVGVAFGAPYPEGHALLNEFYRITMATRTPLFFVEAHNECVVPAGKTPRGADPAVRDALHAAADWTELAAAWNASEPANRLSIHSEGKMTVLVLAGKEFDCETPSVVPPLWASTVEPGRYEGAHGLGHMLVGTGLALEPVMSGMDDVWQLDESMTLAAALAEGGEPRGRGRGGYRVYSLFVYLDEMKTLVLSAFNAHEPIHDW